MILLCSLSLVGCLTGFGFVGRSQLVTINSDVPEVEVIMDNKIIGVTPFKGKVPTKKITTVTLRKEGYEPTYIQLNGETRWVPMVGQSLMSTTSFGVSVLGMPYTSKSHSSGGGAEFTPMALVTAGAGAMGMTSVAGLMAAGGSGAAYQYVPDTYMGIMRKEAMSATDYWNEFKLCQFAMLNHYQIALELGEPAGEYTKALVAMMTEKMAEAVATESIKTALQTSQGDQALFGNELLRTFRESN
jgi:hypothetical protein